LQLPSGADRNASITFSSLTTADAIKYFANNRQEVCALNFANGSAVGGGYKNGAIAQEEDLCRRCPNLFTSLLGAKKAGFYPFGPGARDPGRYSDVLFTPDIMLARGSEDDGFPRWPEQEQVKCSIVTAAAPNLNREMRGGGDVKDVVKMYNAIKAILIAPVLLNPRINTLVLGAWGCGVFRCDPVEMSDLFAQALVLKDRLGRFYDNIHFAIPSFSAEDQNGKIFKDTMTRHRIPFKELS